MSRHPRHDVEDVLQVLHESALEKADLLAQDLHAPRRRAEGLRAYLYRLDQELGRDHVREAAQVLLTRLRAERGGGDRVA